MYQTTIFDFLEKPEVKLGYFEGNIYEIAGKELTFADLKNYKGKKVLVQGECGYYKVYEVMDYKADVNTIYKRVRPLPPNNCGYGEFVNDYIHDVCGIKECMACYEPYKTYGQLALNDSEHSKKANSWIAEYWNDTELDFTNHPYKFWAID